MRIRNNISEDRKIRDHSTIEIKGTQANLLCVFKGVYGDEYMYHVGSALEVLKYSTGYMHHNVFTLYEALIHLCFKLLNEGQLIHLMKNYFKVGRTHTTISVTDMVAAMISELTNLQIYDHVGDKMKVLVDYDNSKIPDLAGHLEQVYVSELEKAASAK